MNKVFHNFASRFFLSDTILYPFSLYSRQIAGTLVILFIARYLSVYEYGIFSSYKTIAAFILMFANLGFADYILVSSQNVVREVKLKIGFFIINAFMLMALVILSCFFFSISNKLIFILVLIRTFFDATFMAIMLPFFQASKKFNIISYVNIFYSVATILIALISYIFQFSLSKFLILSILLGLFNFIQVSFYSRMNYIMSFIHIKRILQKLDKSVFSYISVTICWYLYNQLPSLYSSLFVPKQEAALYFAAFTIANIINLLLIAQTQKIMPELIAAPIEKVKQTLSINMKFILSINLLVFIVFSLFGKFILLLIYSKEYYANAYLILLLLTLSNISIAVAAIYGAYITASGNQKIKIKMQNEAIIICIIALLIFHAYGIYAATIAYMLSATHIGIRYVHKTKQILRENVQ